MTSRGGEPGVPSLHHIRVPRSARYALLGTPSGDVRELWIVLHGYRQLAPRFIRRFTHLASPHRLVAAPEALNRFYVGDEPGRHGPDSRVGGTWMTREDRDAEIADYVGYLDLLHRDLSRALPPGTRTVALGFSQGAHTAARWAAYGEARLDHLVLWGEILPGDLDPDRARKGLASLRVISVQGRGDPHVTPDLLARQAERAEALGVGAELLWHPGGHRVEREPLDRVVAMLGDDARPAR